jgi:hypothetical protein
MDQEAKYLNFGDLILLNPAEAARPEVADACKTYDKKEAYLHGEGFHDLRLGVASDPDDIQKCMFCVSNQLQYAAEKALRKFCEQKGDFTKQTASHMLAPDSVVSFLASNLLKEQKKGCVSMPKEVVQHKMAEMKFRKIKEMLEENVAKERKKNFESIHDRTRHGQSICYNQVVQLKHMRSGKFLTANFKKVADVEKDAMTAVLAEDGNEGSWWVLEARFNPKQRSAGPVHIQEQVVIKSYQNPSYRLHTNGRTVYALHNDMYEPPRNEVNLCHMTVAAGWHVKLHCKHDERSLMHLKIGQAIRLYQHEASGFVGASANQTKPKPPYLAHCSNLDPSHVANFSAKQLFIVENTEDKGGHVHWGQQCLLRHVASKRYLAVDLDEGGTYDIIYDTGEREVNVDASRIKSVSVGSVGSSIGGKSPFASSAFRGGAFGFGGGAFGGMGGALVETYEDGQKVEANLRGKGKFLPAKIIHRRCSNMVAEDLTYHTKLLTKRELRRRGRGTKRPWKSLHFLLRPVIADEDESNEISLTQSRGHGSRELELRIQCVIEFESGGTTKFWLHNTNEAKNRRGGNTALHNDVAGGGDAAAPAGGGGSGTSTTTYSDGLNYTLGFSEESSGIATDQQSFNVFSVHDTVLAKVEEMVSRNDVGTSFVRSVEKWYEWEQNSDNATRVVQDLLSHSIALLTHPGPVLEQQQLARELKFVDMLFEIRRETLAAFELHGQKQQVRW